ncbi:hypothetical protein CJF24_20745 [Aeromonas veronii]|uniref:DUF2384 domain-containing protein n=1 Tax=Aeromonas veronii TaxID=654 RepID=A0ABY3MG96_AERVE|nr:hypothetical protein [Aeromonas veronii]RDU78565.1 hypothetical protein CGZ76_21690 [Aeromonas veronii]TEY44857.1 hypothetical protein CIG14_21550 [Aeromonas veronii]TEY71563.1 hypothetical protein CIG16_21265 [Aeromonas veronii]TYD40375.1 hypothetical protein CJF24_20745 [Aeromonas veronii]
MLKNRQIANAVKEHPKLNVSTGAHIYEQVLSLSTWLTAREVAVGAGCKEVDPSGLMDKWKKAGKIFALSVKGQDLFPAYALGVDGKPLPQMKEVLAILSVSRKPLAIASWFASANSWLACKAPMDEIAEHPLEVLKAASREVAPIEHG